MEVIKSGQTKINLNALQIIEGIKSKDPRAQQEFQTIFFNRYKGYVYKGAIKLCANFRDPEQLALDITQQTFINACNKIKDFDLKKEPNSEKHEVIIKAWLGRIANNCFKKEYAVRKNKLFIDELAPIPETEDYDFYESTFGEDSIDIPNEFRIKLNDAMNNLNEVQKHVLLTYAAEGCLDSSQHLSKNTLEYLCKTYNTTSANIRQIKKRALDKVKKHCFQTK